MPKTFVIIANYTNVSSMRLKLLQTHLCVKAIIMDIHNFRGTIEELEMLNEAGREKLAELRKCIEQFGDLANDANDRTLLQEVEKHRSHLFSTQHAFWNANLSKLVEISKANKEELFALRSDTSKVRSKTVRRSAIVMLFESNIEWMHLISQQLFEIIQKYKKTLHLLHVNFPNAQDVANEQENLAEMIDLSRRLLWKHSRRECTDKILAAFGLTLFLVSVIYVLSRRLF
ncbi:vesicle transport protein SEC20-like [Anopheles ziemanni]|uniref:vesicle transport protein SEC20-like n=1 Tax=Anopheles coustani TaxID=139045 RepID=UPI002657D88D|nr:vesicle transport protein SEC20-like [Anopheles coustani]XP_058176296.1 vesicle transport protein SEC20-like [Anopheles ziemanni]